MRTAFAGMILWGLAGLGSGVSAQTPSSRSVAFANAAQPTIRFKAEKAIVFDGEGHALFQADQAFVLDFAKNPQGKVFEWRPAQRLVRISPPGGPAVWLHCGDLEVMAIACSKLRFTVDTDGGVRISATDPKRGPKRDGSLGPDMNAPSARGVPNCPGDPRCPKLGGS